jgi:hypothetical protein
MRMASLSARRGIEGEVLHKLNGINQPNFRLSLPPRFYMYIFKSSQQQEATNSYF